MELRPRHVSAVVSGEGKNIVSTKYRPLLSPDEQPCLLFSPLGMGFSWGNFSRSAGTVKTKVPTDLRKERTVFQGGGKGLLGGEGRSLIKVNMRH